MSRHCLNKEHPPWPSSSLTACSLGCAARVVGCGTLLRCCGADAFVPPVDQVPKPKTRCALGREGSEYTMRLHRACSGRAQSCPARATSRVAAALDRVAARTTGPRRRRPSAPSSRTSWCRSWSPGPTRDAHPVERRREGSDRPIGDLHLREAVDEVRVQTAWRRRSRSAPPTRRRRDDGMSVLGGGGGDDPLDPPVRGVVGDVRDVGVVVPAADLAGAQLGD